MLLVSGCRRQQRKSIKGWIYTRDWGLLEGVKMTWRFPEETEERQGSLEGIKIGFEKQEAGC